MLMYKIDEKQISIFSGTTLNIRIPGYDNYVECAVVSLDRAGIDA
jgi:hypothetical protein